jgi:hypothetical protein
VVGEEAPGLSATIGVETINGDGVAEFVQSLDIDLREMQGICAASVSGAARVTLRSAD